MLFFYYVFIFLIGLSLGSFLNVVIFRFNTGHSAVRGKSKCVNCQLTIRWFDLMPVLSYFLLGGKCRNCRKKISPMYPVVELSVAVILLLFFSNIQQPSYLAALNALIILLFTLIIFLDVRYFIIPDKILASLAIVTTGSKLLDGNTDFSHLLIFALGLTSFFAILFLVSRGKWIGFGDVKLILLIGFLLGYPLSYLAVILSIWIAAIFSIILLIAKRATAKTEISFGAFLSAITVVFIIFGHELQKISQYFY